MLCFWRLNFDAGITSSCHRGAEGSLLAALFDFISAPPDLGYVMYVAQLLGIAASTGWNFVANLFWTWREKLHLDWR